MLRIESRKQGSPAWACYRKRYLIRSNNEKEEDPARHGRIIRVRKLKEDKHKNTAHSEAYNVAFKSMYERPTVSQGTAIPTSLMICTVQYWRTIG